MPSAGSFLRQLSGKEAWKSTSNKWSASTGSTRWSSNDGINMNMNMSMSMSSMYGWHNGYHQHHHHHHQSQSQNSKKRVMVVVDESSRSKHAMMWALTHVTNNGDCLTLLHILSPESFSSSSSSSCSSSPPSLARSLASLCKASKPQVEVEAVVIQGPKLATVLSQVKKLEVSVLVLAQKKPSPIITRLFGRSNTEDFVEKCINSAECLTIAVRKQSKSMGGYLISTRWQKNFWLLA